LADVPIRVEASAQPSVECLKSFLGARLMHLILLRTQTPRWNKSSGKEKEMKTWIVGFVALTGLTCLMVGSALAQSQTPPAQTPTERDMRSDSGSMRPLPPPTPPVPMVRGGKAANRGNQDVQAPRENQDVQAPRGNQDVQAPRENQEVQAPRGTQNRNARDNQDVQSPRASRMGNGQDVRAAQEALKSKGFDPGEIDGRMGPRTQAAISEFQRSAGLRETGRFDQATRSQLGIH
jgi:Putative peptidoglycan binding domain